MFLLAAFCLVIFMQAFVLCWFSALLVNYQMTILEWLRKRSWERFVRRICTLYHVRQELRFLNDDFGEIASKKHFKMH